jgi:RNA polymerase sigma-70 factor, ECF subfamily
MREVQPHAADDRLLARAKAGDAAACRTLVELHQRRVFAQLRGLLRPSGREAYVEDLAQETFLRAFRSLDRFTGDVDRALGAWLVTIATRVGLNELRKKAPRPSELDTIDETLSTRKGDPTLSGRLIGRGIDEAVGELPPAYRAAFLLRELHGFEYAEIASLLEIDLGTVKSRLSRARSRLREALTRAQATREEHHET